MVPPSPTPQEHFSFFSGIISAQSRLALKLIKVKYQHSSLSLTSASVSAGNGWELYNILDWEGSQGVIRNNH